MSESEKLLSKKGAKRSHSGNHSGNQSGKKQQHKLFASQDNYGTLTKQYIVEEELPRTHFSALHCILVSFVFIFCLVFITTSLLIGLPRVRQRYQEFYELNGVNTLNTTTLNPTYTSTIGSLI